MNRVTIVAIVLALGCISIDAEEDSVLLTVYYESYCPFSIMFIDEQLYDTWMYFMPYLKVEMVPFGNAKQTYHDGHFNFKCIHGHKECVGNILHACAIYNACGDKTTKDCPTDQVTKVMKYIRCLVREKDQNKSSHKCAWKAGLDSRSIDQCAQGQLGNTLESLYGNETAAFTNPPVDHVPFVTVNGKFDEDDDLQARVQLQVLICKYLPEHCHH